MFLAPAIVAALGYELVSAFQTTEHLPTVSTVVKPDTTTSQEVQQPLQHRRFADSSDSMSDKQIVVFGDKSNPGINTLTTNGSGSIWSQSLSNSDLSNLVSRGREAFSGVPITKLACDALAGSVLTGASAQIASDLCFNAVKELVTKAIPITKDAVKRLATSAWSKMTKSKKSAVPQAALAKVANKVARAVGKTPALPPGMYQAGVSAPVSSSRVIGRAGRPSSRNTTRGVVIRHAEMLGTLYSSSSANTYQSQSFTINPGKSWAFPWLSTIATNYDKYRIRSMNVILNTMQPTSVAGKIGICYDPDSTDAMPVDRTEFFATYKNVEGPVWQSISLALPVSGKELFLNTHTTSDSKLVDDGQFIVMSDLLSGTTVALADMVVSYEVELLDPQQALFTTQDLQLTGVTYTGLRYITNLASPLGPHIGEIYHSTSTIMYMVLPPGTYRIGIHCYDSAAGSPVMVAHNGTYNTSHYTKYGVANGYHYEILAKFVTSNTTDPPSGETIGITFSVVTVANLEAIRFLITRISPTEFSNFGGFLSSAAGADM